LRFEKYAFVLGAMQSAIWRARFPIAISLPGETFAAKICTGDELLASVDANLSRQSSRANNQMNTSMFRIRTLRTSEIVRVAAPPRARYTRELECWSDPLPITLLCG
jgi:hypothetical protein